MALQDLVATDTPADFAAGLSIADGKWRSMQNMSTDARVFYAARDAAPESGAPAFVLPPGGLVEIKADPGDKYWAWCDHGQSARLVFELAE